MTTLLDSLQEKASLWVPERELALMERDARPQRGLPEIVNDWRSDNWRHHTKAAHRDVSRAVKTCRKSRAVAGIYGQLYVKPVLGACLPIGHPERVVLPFGLASLRVVTTAGVNFFTDSWQNLVEMEDMKYHGVGTGSTAEGVGETALVTELTTEYNPDSTRATGTLEEGASANIFKTVATNNFDATVALREHGVFDQAATGGGTLWDRSLYAAINLASGDGIQTDYRLTTAAGG